MRKVLVLLGCLDPVIRQAVASSLNGVVILRESPYRGKELIDAALREGAQIIIASRDDAADICDDVPPNLLLVGLSAASFDVLVCAHGRIRHLLNPTLEQLSLLVESIPG